MKVTLDQAWIYQGRTCGPGQVEIPDALAEILRRRGRLPTEEGTLPAASPAPARTGPLPEDFPAREALADAKINTYEEVASFGDLTVIEGIGPATAKKIRAALAGEEE